MNRVKGLRDRSELIALNMRSSNQVSRASATPKKVMTLTMGQRFITHEPLI